MFKTSKIRIACLILLFSIHSIYLNRVFANGYKMKTIVLDAGQGGQDSGCHGHDGSYEKDVTLKGILALGKLVEQKYPDIKVLYSRKTDVFITLQDRALLANKNNADLFISVHCNANNNKSAYGAEPFLMGLHLSQANLDVAKRENEVIKLEDNYKETYGDFDPDFVQLLKEHDLYPELTPTYDHVDGAWVPSSLVKTLYARRRDTPVEAPKM